MAPKKGTIKKATAKITAPSVDAELFNNGEKKVVEDLANNAKILPTDNSLNDREDFKESTKLKATKRVSGRAKNVVAELDIEAPPSKKPVTKGRGKKKTTGIEVIENEANNIQPEIQEVEGEKVKTKRKVRDGGKTVEPQTRKITNLDEIKKETIENDVQEEDSKKVQEIKLPEKNKKTVGGRKKKQQIVPKIEDQIVKKEELEDDLVEEKTPKKLSRHSVNTEEITAVISTEISTEIKPQKKTGKVNKKEEKLIEEEKSPLTVAEIDDAKTEVIEKKPVKRGRRTAKTVTPIEETESINGDTEEVIPKKRSRKAVSSEKEVVTEKPKKGRNNKADQIKKDVIEKDAEDNEESVKPANGEVQKKNNQNDEEPIPANKKTELNDAVVAKRSKGGRKRVAPSTNNKKSAKAVAEDDEVSADIVDSTVAVDDKADGSKSSKTKRSKTDSAPVNATDTKYNKADFDLRPPSDGEIADEPRYNLKISSWNVAGLRSWVNKGGLKFLDYEQPDIFCMQETKCTNDQLPEEVVRIQGYHPYWLCMPGGYAGVAIYSKIMPINVEYGIGNKEFDNCGRIITAEYEKFFLINVYVPNSGRKLVNLDARMKWEELFQQFVQNLNARKPVIICGDMNVSHQEHDLANPKSNTRNAGFTKEERGKMTELLALGYIDTFRHLYPDRKGAYTYWTYMGNARSRNVGWRLDYFIVSERFIKRVVDNCMRNQCLGSDHCPITLYLKL